MTRVLGKIVRSFIHLFKERQIYHRSDGVVRFVKLSRRKQVIGSVITLGVMLWFAYASVNVGLQRSIIVANEKEFRQRVDIYRDQLRRSESAYNSINELNEIFSREYEAAISKVETRHEALRRLVESKNKSRDELADFARNLSQAEGPNGRQIKSGNRVMIDPFGREPTPRQNRTSRIRQNALESAATNSLSPNVKNDLLIKMQQSTAELLSEQAFALAMLEETSRREVEELEEIISSTGISKTALVLPAIRAYATRRAHAYAGSPKTEPDAVARNAARNAGSVDRTDGGNEILNGRGGPHVERGDPFKNALQRIESNLEEAEIIAGLLSQMPISSPLTERYRITEKFGLRKTPRGLKPRNRSGIEPHNGLDLAKRPNCPIVATAAGRIAKVTRSAYGFGNSVIIDHGNGFETLYAHLSEIKVSKGQKINLHDTIGLMGTSGRSNGFHVHYEVRFNGKSLDPMKFIEAGRYVFES